MQAYVSCADVAESGHIEWRIDFSSCGLVIMNTQIKVMSSISSDDAQPAGISYLVRGDNTLLSPQLGGKFIVSASSSFNSLSFYMPSYLTYFVL